MNIRYEPSPKRPARRLVFRKLATYAPLQSAKTIRQRKISMRIGYEKTDDKEQSRSRVAHHVALALVLVPWIFHIANADNPDEVVRWTASVTSTAAVTGGSTATLDLSGEIQAGWHVYALEQHTGGPTPLRITIDANNLATAAGPTTGTAPDKVHDAHFGFDTQLYTNAFVVHLPVRVVPVPATGRLLIPVSVRFQACSDRECLLPRTVHLSVPLAVMGHRAS